MSSEEDKRYIELKVGLETLNATVVNVTKTIGNLSDTINHAMDKMENSSNMLIKLIEQKDEKYNEKFITKEAHKVLKDDITDVKAIIRKINWSLLGVFGMFIFNILIKLGS